MLSAEQKRELEATLQSFVGKPIGPPDVARDPVNVPMIHQWCDAMGDRNPVYTDADAAAKSVHGGIVAPPTDAAGLDHEGLGHARGLRRSRATSSSACTSS